MATHSGTQLKGSFPLTSLYMKRYERMDLHRVNKVKPDHSGGQRFGIKKLHACTVSP
uniref:Uncharacterized protein n=1 Tax=Anguilla anguilla TaxID=7936 RepID=A0A0E9XDE0_ANGAN